MSPKKGDRVRIKKGAVLRSTSPSKDGPYKAGMSYKVTVNHTLDGVTILLGWQYEDGEVRLGGTHWRTLFRYLDGLLPGLSYNDFCGGYKQDHAALLERIKTELGDRFCEERGGRHPRGADLYLRVVDPKVRWAGSGGYWVEASVDEVEKLDV
tara:strand:- start:177 stop:635 length:459 start_codon:yes stop_codon:yes gene_type:complete